MTGLKMDDLPSLASFEADLKKIYGNLKIEHYDWIIMSLNTQSITEKENKDDSKSSITI